jgi:two-component system, NarL family, nitrate/nitrite response regulator NarL
MQELSTIINVDSSNNSPQQLIRVLIADDHVMVAQMLSQYLDEKSDFKTITSSDFESTINLVKGTDKFDLVLLDLVMPGMDGLESVRKILAEAGDSKVVIFSANIDRYAISSALASGVKGIIPKQMPIKSLISALKLVLSEEVFVPSSLLQTKMSGKDLHDLTDIELFVLQCAGRGLTNKHIAAETGKNESGIKMYMRSICMKLNARNRAHACMIGRRSGIIV